MRALRLPVEGQYPLVIARSEATWQSHAGSFEFAENHLKIKTILRDCHGRKRPRNDMREVAERLARWALLGMTWNSFFTA